jgi:hypothetical protein
MPDHHGFCNNRPAFIRRICGTVPQIPEMKKPLVEGLLAGLLT